MFNSGGKRWKYDLVSNKIQVIFEEEQVTSFLPAGVEPHPSQWTGEETTITFANHGDDAVEVYWIDTEGHRHLYATIPAGSKHCQHTFAGHVWLVAQKEGDKIAVFVATENPAEAIVDSSSLHEAPDGSRLGSRSRLRGVESPDGKWVVFVKDYNLYVCNLKSNEEISLSNDGAEDDAYEERFYWSPDSERLVALRTKKGYDRQIHLIESSPKEQLYPKLHTLTYRKPGDDIPIAMPQLFNVTKGQHIAVSSDLFANPWSVSDIHWMPDSSRFTFLYNQRGHQVLRIVSVDAETGQACAIVDEQSKTFIEYEEKEFSYYLDETDEIIWMSERDGWNHLYLYDSQTGRVKNQITKGPWVVRSVERVDEQKRKIWFEAGGIRPAQDPYYVHLCRVNFDGSDLVVLTEGNGTHKITFSPDHRFFLDQWSRVDHPPVTELRDAEEGRLVCVLEQADWAELMKTGWRPPDRFVAKGRDGETDIYGIIIRPCNFDPTRKYAVIEKIYAGPHAAFVPKSFGLQVRERSLAELGFIVVQIDGMGTSYRSKAFHDVCWKNLGDSGFPDRIPWMKAAAAKYPEMDISRVGIYGSSAGGQSALRALLAYGDFYKVAVADCGCHDNRMDKIWWNELWMGWPIGPEYEEQSNVTQAHNLKGKLLLISGELDRNVDPASTMQVVNALIKADKDFDMLVIPGGEHGAGLTPYGLRRQMDFFVRHLLGVEPPTRGQTRSLYMAARLGDIVIVKSLIGQGVDLNMKDTQNRTPLHYAAKEGHNKIVELLLDSGADVNAGANDGQTAAEMALWANHNEILELLIIRGANDISPLHLAVHKGDLAEVRNLVEKGADVNNGTRRGTTPLHTAAAAGLDDVAALLIEKGADVNAKMNWPWTPIHSAAENGYKDIVELLIAHGANVNAEDGARRTPLYYAKEKRHTEIVELLRKHGAKE
jgi:dipeptidyl aminopeptidase/acylaminoacyl peptidase